MFRNADIKIRAAVRPKAVSTTVSALKQMLIATLKAGLEGSSSRSAMTAQISSFRTISLPQLLYSVLLDATKNSTTRLIDLVLELYTAVTSISRCYELFHFPPPLANYHPVYSYSSHGGSENVLDFDALLGDLLKE